jgi:hypothetical protein
LQWSCGDLNVHLKGAAEVEKMEDRAVKRGLTNPATLLINELNELETEVSSFEAEQRELHMGQRGRLALPQGRHQAQLEEGEGEDEIEVAMPRRVGRLNLEEYILYE